MSCVYQSFTWPCNLPSKWNWRCHQNHLPIKTNKWQIAAYCCFLVAMVLNNNLCTSKKKKWAVFPPTGATDAENTLMKSLFTGYNVKVRPAETPDQKVVVRVGMVLSSLVALVWAQRTHTHTHMRTHTHTHTYMHTHTEHTRAHKHGTHTHAHTHKQSIHARTHARAHRQSIPAHTITAWWCYGWSWPRQWLTPWYDHRALEELRACIWGYMWCINMQRTYSNSQ